MDIAKLLDALQLSSGRLLAFFLIVVLSAGVVIFAPTKVLVPLGIHELPVLYGLILGIVFVSSAIGTTITGIIFISKPIKRTIDRWLFLKSGKKRLHSLTSEERTILSRFIKGQTRTQWLRPDNGIARGLISAGIIYQSSNEGEILRGFPHNIRPWAWEYLNLHPELVLETILENKE